MANGRELTWSVASEWGSVPAGSEYSGYEPVENIPGYTVGIPAGMEDIAEPLPTIPPLRVSRPPVQPPVLEPLVKQVSNGLMPTVFNGEAAGAPAPQVEQIPITAAQMPFTGQVPGATPLALPLVVGAGAVASRFMTVGFLKVLLARYGASALRLIIGAALFTAFMELFDEDDETLVKPRHKRRRYTFTMNSRIGTIAKSGKAMLKILKRHKKVINQLLPERKPFPASALAKTYLSAAERKLLK